MADIAFTPDRILYGIRDEALYEIDTIDGTTNLIHTFNSFFDHILGLGSNCNGELITYTYSYVTGSPADSVFFGEVLSYDPISNIETNHGMTGYPGWDVEYFNGKLYSASANKIDFVPRGLCEFTLDSLTSGTLVAQNDFFVCLGLSSIKKNCESGMYAFNLTGMVDYDIPNDTASFVSRDSFSAPFGRIQGATSRTSWVGSLTDFDIDSIIVFEATLGCDPTEIEVYMPDRCIPYLYSLDGDAWQFEHILYPDSVGLQTVYVSDTFLCDIVSQQVMIDTINRRSRVVSLSADSTTCELANGRLSIQTIELSGDSLLFSIDGDPFERSYDFDSLAVGFHELFVMSETGCLDTFLFSIGGIPLASFAITTQDITCHQAGQLMVSANQNNGQYRIDNQPWQSINQVTNNLDTGSYIISILDSNLCIQTEVIHIGEIPLPTIQVAFTNPTCGLDNGIIQITSSVATDSIFILSETFLGTGILNDLAAGNILLSVKDSIGCRIDSVVVLQSQPTANIIDVNYSGDNCDTLFDIQINTSGSDVINFTIDGLFFQFDSLFLDQPAGSYLAVIEDATGCLDSVLLNIPIRILPQIQSLVILPETCDLENGSVNISAVGDPQLSFRLERNWSIDSVFENMRGGDYLLTIQDGFGCEIDSLVRIPAIAPPSVADITINPAHCDLDDGSITVLVSGAAPFELALDSRPSQIDFTFNQVGSGVHYLSITDTYGCVIIDTLIVETIDGPVIDSVISKPASCLLTDGSIQIFASGSAPLSYALNMNSAQSSATFLDLIAANYQITVFDAAGCRQSINSVVDQLPALEWRQLTVDHADCVDLFGSIAIEVFGGLPPYRITLNGGIEVNEIIEIEPGSYELSIFDQSACRIDSLIDINGMRQRDIETMIGNPACGELFGSLVFGGADIPILLSIDGVQSQVDTVNLLIPGQHEINISSDSIFCEWTSVINIPVPSCNYFVPNVFSPNNDGINDVFYVMSSAASTSTYSISIFDRWGSRVFHRSDARVNLVDTGWDGLIDGQPAQQGVYIYSIKIIKPDGSEELIKGDLQLLR